MKDNKNRRIRIGIDVGGTFTDAVAINNDTLEIVAKEKVLTTHTAEEGVARGIINIIEKIIENNDISPQEVVFIAHGTTQATNALLEGDVSKVGIIGMGTGVDAIKSKSEANVEEIELAPRKLIETEYKFIDSKNLEENQKELREIINYFEDKGVEVIVASEAYSVDNPQNENIVLRYAREAGFYGTSGHEISKLYGLKTRTRTAVVNGSIIPTMMETANMTEKSVVNVGIKSPLMIMRCDGGVMTADEMRSRPILTMLSGPAAGVAGVLMYEKISDGIFLEVGGTSTDISVIKNGKVMIDYASIGGHKTYINSLDVRTVGIAGGSLIEVKNGKITNVGPRSAHILGLEYEIFAKDGDIVEPSIEYIKSADDGDKSYAAIRSKNGKIFALTLAGAANIAGMIKDDDYAKGNMQEGKKAYEALAEELNLSLEETIKQVLDKGIGYVEKVVDEMVNEYELEPNMVHLVGGGGSASVVVPYLAKKTGYKHSISKNAPYISTIGVALAMVRDVVERTIANPGDEDIKQIRREAFDLAVESGAMPETIEVLIEIDKQRNIVRGIATGSTELRTKDLLAKELSDHELKDIAAKSMGVSVENVKLEEKVGKWLIFKGEKIEKRFLGLFNRRVNLFRLLDREGVVRLQKKWGKCKKSVGNNLIKDLNQFISENTYYGDGAEEVPNTYILYGQRIIDLSGLGEKSKIISLAELEVENIDKNEEVIIFLAR